MKRHFVPAMIALCSVLAFVACDGGQGAEGGLAGSLGGTGGTAGSGGTGAVGGTGGTGGCLNCCVSCPCDFKSTDMDPGCADVCDNTISGQPTPNYCNGSSALAECEACILMRCGLPSANCN